MKKFSVRLLLTCASGSMSRYLIQELRKSDNIDYFIVGVSASAIDHETTSLLNQVHRVPYGTDKSFCSVVLQICKATGIDIVLPGADEEVFSLALHRQQFTDAGISLLIGSSECLDSISNKRNVYERLRESNIRSPDVLPISVTSDFKKALEYFKFPSSDLVFKPSSGRGGRDVFYLLGKEDSQRIDISNPRLNVYNKSMLSRLPVSGLLHKYGEMLLMPKLNEPCYDVDVVSFDGTVVCVPRQRVNPAGIPFEGNIINNDAIIVDYCKQVCTALRLDSVLDIDVMTDSTGCPVVLEINPRASGSLAAALAAGFPLVDIAISLKLGFGCHTVEDLPLRDLIYIEIDNHSNMLTRS